MSETSGTVIEKEGDSHSLVLRKLRDVEHKLKSALREKHALEEKVKECDEYLRDFKTLTAFAELPKLPYHTCLKLPEKKDYSSNKVTTERFDMIMEELRVKLFEFKYSARKSVYLRRDICKTVAILSEPLKEKIREVAVTDEALSNDQNYIVELLSKILESSAPEQSMPGDDQVKVLRQLSYICEDIPIPRFLCSELLAAWKGKTSGTE